jgi:hypothetical protein
MRIDAKAYTDLDKFAFLGFSIREWDVPKLRTHKPESRVITVDTMLSPIFPAMNDFPYEDMNGTPNMTQDIQSSLIYIEEVFKGIDPAIKANYRIYGYAIELERAFLYTYDFNLDKPDSRYSVYKFAYAISNIIFPHGNFKGFDVVDATVEWTSALTNCGISWTIIEQCGQLNAYNLFSNYKDALCFRTMADDIVQEHSPFAVWAVYEVDDELVQETN